jgi:hypothetical protein
MNTIFFHWDIQPDKDKEYREFIFGEYLPSMSRLGITVTDGWLRMAGEGPQIMAIGESDNYNVMLSAIESREFKAIEARLLKYVENYSKHVTRKGAGKKNNKDSWAD